MKSKMIILTLALMVVSGSLFAEGMKHPGERGKDERDTISISGPVKFKGLEHPVIEADGIKYELMFPYHLVEGLKVKEGDVITVEGFLEEERCCRDDKGTDKDASAGVRLMVTKAVINGKEVVVDKIGPRESCDGPARGHHGGPR